MDPLLHALVQNSSDAIVMLDEGGRVLFASEPSARLLGYTLEERMGHSAFDLLHPDDIPHGRTMFAELLQRPGGLVRGECGLGHKDGQWPHVAALALNRPAEPADAPTVPD